MLLRTSSMSMVQFRVRLVTSVKYSSREQIEPCYKSLALVAVAEAELDLRGRPAQRDRPAQRGRQGQLDLTTVRPVR